MSWLSRLWRGGASGHAEKAANPITEIGYSSIMVGGVTKSGESVTTESAMACSAVMACIRIISEDVAKLPVQVYRRLADGGSQAHTGHALHTLLRNPNEWQTRFDLFEGMVHSMLLYGNWYAVILRDGRGRPVRLIPVPAPSVIPQTSLDDGSIFYSVGRTTVHLQVVLRNMPSIIPARDVMHVRCLSYKELLGESTVLHVREPIGMAMAAESYGASLFRNGARPSGVLTYPQRLSEEAYRRLQESWDAKYGGSSKAGKTAVLEEGGDYKQLSMTSVDAEWLSTRKFQVEEVARAFRVPLHMLQMMDRSTFNNIEHQSRAYYDQTLMPYLERIEAAFDKHFSLHEDGSYVEFDTAALLRADIKTRYDAYARGRQWGWMSANDVLLREGRSPIGPEGDVYMVPANMMPATSWLQQEDNSSQNAPEDGGNNE